MKILFISNGCQPDYLCDSVYHGLKSVYGQDVEAANDMWFMYDTLLDDERGYLYGRGFTLYGLLNRDVKVVPSVAEIKMRIAENYYSYIIYGSINRCKQFFKIVSQYYTADKIIFIDGEDRTNLQQEFIKKGFYFKRELTNEQRLVYPISFAIPIEKIVDAAPRKLRDWAINYPGKLDTYIHKKEFSYYDDYQSSKFAVTFKKEGWDCLRHYEILANGCLPYFKDIDQCPPETMVNFPKGIVSDIKNKIEKKVKISEAEYLEFVNNLLDYTRTNLTTTALIGYIFNVVKTDGPLFKNNYQKQSVGYEPEEGILKASYIDKVLSQIDEPQRIIVHFGLSSVQELRYLETKDLKIYVHSAFKSALPVQWAIDSKISVLAEHEFSNVVADVVILDMTLPYQDDVLAYMQSIIKLMHKDTRLILIIPNYKSISTVIGFIKNDLKFGRLTLAKGAQVNFYSKQSLVNVMKSFNLVFKHAVAYDFDESHVVKRTLNKVNSLKYFTCRKILMEVRLGNE